jgi:hypothetical protein
MRYAGSADAAWQGGDARRRRNDFTGHAARDVARHTHPCTEGHVAALGQRRTLGDADDVDLFIGQICSAIRKARSQGAGGQR